jgi:hypothetical protein
VCSSLTWQRIALPSQPATAQLGHKSGSFTLQCVLAVPVGDISFALHYVVAPYEFRTVQAKAVHLAGRASLAWIAALRQGFRDESFVTDRGNGSIHTTCILFVDSQNEASNCMSYTPDSLGLQLVPYKVACWLARAFVGFCWYPLVFVSIRWFSSRVLVSPNCAFTCIWNAISRSGENKNSSPTNIRCAL